MASETLVKKSSRLGRGVFTIRDMSQILGINPAQLRYWVKEYWDRKFVSDKGTKYSWGEQAKVVDFYTLMEIYVYARLRESGVTPQKILLAHSTLSKLLKTSFPFAHASILTDRKHVYFENGLGEIVHADKTKQINLDKIIKPFCERIDFDESGMPVRYCPRGKKSSVVVDPKHQFGLPTIDGTNLRAETIYRMYLAGESKALIATLYDLDKKQVNDAIEFFKAA